MILRVSLLFKNTFQGKLNMYRIFKIRFKENWTCMAFSNQKMILFSLKYCSKKNKTMISNLFSGVQGKLFFIWLVLTSNLIKWNQILRVVWYCWTCLFHVYEKYMHCIRWKILTDSTWSQTHSTWSVKALEPPWERSLGKVGGWISASYWSQTKL